MYEEELSFPREVQRPTTEGRVGATLLRLLESQEVKQLLLLMMAVPGVSKIV